jgi:hypothetical protein
MSHTWSRGRSAPQAHGVVEAASTAAPSVGVVLAEMLSELSAAVEAVMLAGAVLTPAAGLAPEARCGPAITAAAAIAANNSQTAEKRRGLRVIFEAGSGIPVSGAANSCSLN